MSGSTLKEVSDFSKTSLWYDVLQTSREKFDAIFRFDLSAWILHFYGMSSKGTIQPYFLVPESGCVFNSLFVIHFCWLLPFVRMKQYKAV